MYEESAEALIYLNKLEPILNQSATLSAGQFFLRPSQASGNETNDFSTSISQRNRVLLR